MAAGVDRRELAPMVSPTAPDWSREQVRGQCDPGRRLLRTIRQYQKWRRRRGPLSRLVTITIVIRYRIWQCITGADIPLDTRIGGGLLIPHPNGIVIHNEAIIGPNCLIFQQVTLGTRERREGAPVIGGHVDIGAGARILGPVRIGDHAVIGANAVVLDDVPPGAIAVGIPARIITRD